LDWFLYRPGLPFLRFCYAGRIINDLTDKYTLETVTDGYNMTIRSLKFDDTGDYVCKENKNEKNRYVVDVNSRSTALKPTSTTSQTDNAGRLSLYVVLLPRQQLR